MALIRNIILFIIIYLGWACVLTTESTIAQTRYKIAQVRFEGNERFSDTTLRRLMISRPHRWYAKSYFRPEIFQDDLEAISNFYLNEGYLDAKIIDHQVQIDTASQRVNIQIRIEEGVQTRISDVAFFGNRIFPDSVLMRKIKSAVGKPFRKNILEDDRYQILFHYANHGYIEANVMPSLKLNAETHEMLIDFNIDEGPLVSIGAIKLDGIKKTRPNVVFRQLAFRSGDTYNYANILISQRQLYLTGLFSNVIIRSDEKVDNLPMIRNITISLEEKKNGEINFGFGYGTLDRLRGSVELLHNNLFGTGRQAGISGFASAIARRAELSFTDRWLFGSRTKADLNGYFEQRAEPAYHLDRHGFKFTLGKKLGNFSNLNLTYRYEIAQRKDKLNGLAPKSDDKGNTRSLTGLLIRDSRDDLINTTRGSFASLNFESAGAFLRGTATFYKVTVNFRYFYPLNRRLVIASALMAGWMDRYGINDEIPIQERFFSGGPTSLRGFKEKYVGPKNELNNPVGGTVLLNLNLIEWRYTFYKKFSAITFIDMGNVWKNAEQLQQFNLRRTAGIGLRFNSPLGILRIDYGFKLDRRRDESKGELYFSVGQAF